MSQLANEYKAINLGQGFPDFDMDAALVNEVTAAMKTGNNQYTHMNGYLPLREAIANKIQQLYHHTANPNTDITITPGGTYAIYSALTAIIHKGDEVIVLEPCYDSYIPNIEINGGVAIKVPLSFPNYTVNWQLVQESISPKTKAIIINSPHNPTGAVLSNTDMLTLSNIVEQHNLFVISDEVYEHLIFDDKQHESVLKYPSLASRSFVCFSFGKTYHCTGWKMGYCVASEANMVAFRKVHQFNAFTCPTPPQVAFANYLSNKEAYIGLGKFVQAKRDFFAQQMAATPFTPIPSYGSYFQCYSYAGFSSMPDAEFAVYLTKHFGVTTIPVSAFYANKKDDKVLRFCFTKKEETLLAAATALQKL